MNRLRLSGLPLILFIFLFLMPCGCAKHENSSVDEAEVITEDLSDSEALKEVDEDDSDETVIEVSSVQEAGLLLTFGSNEYGQLGHTTNLNRPKPVRIESPGAVKAISAGKNHSLLLLENGDVYSFGQGESGQLGHGNDEDLFEPTKIEGLSGAVKIAAGSDHSLVLLDNSDVYSFGSNGYGKIGQSQRDNYYVPTKIDGLSRVKDLSTGKSHSLILMENGDVYSIGHASGEIMNGMSDPEYFPLEDHWIPSKVEGVLQARDISASSTHSLITLEDGNTYSFGYPYGGQLGRNYDKGSYRIPKQVENIKNIRSSSAGSHYSLFLLHSGAVYSCGYDWGGRLGKGEVDEWYERVEVPQRIVGLPPIKAVSAGSMHSLVLTESGEVYSFGSVNLLGHSDILNQYNAKRIEGLPRIKAISAGGNHSLLLDSLGNVYSFGIGTYGQLGLGTEGIYDTPTKVAGLTNVIAASGEHRHSLVLLENGEVCSFGSGDRGQLGHGNDKDLFSPQIIKGISNAAAVSAGATYSLVLLDNGGVYSFGYGASGELGNLFDLDFETPETLWRNKPAKIETVSQIKAIATGYSHTYLLRENGYVYYCGGGYWEGQTYEPELSASFGKVEIISVGSPYLDQTQGVLALLENGDVYAFGFGNQPSGPLGLKNVRAIAAGGYHALILLKNGNVLSYGSGNEGQLGHGNNDDLDEPKKIEGISGAVAIAAGEYHSLVLLLNGDVYSFGYGRLGQLGHSGHISTNIPLKITSLDNAVGIAAGANHSLVIKRNIDN